MSDAERLADIRRQFDDPECRHFYYLDVAFLLAELDRARADADRLRAQVAVMAEALDGKW